MGSHTLTGIGSADSTLKGGVTVMLRIWRFLFLAAFVVSTCNVVAAADLPTGKPDSSPPPPVVDQCKAFGPNFNPVGFAPLCYKFGYDARLIVNKDFDAWDMMLTGRRLPTVLHPGGGAPMLFYTAKNWGDRTAAPQLTADVQVNLTVASPTEWGTLVGFVNLRGVDTLVYDTSLSRGWVGEWGLSGYSFLTREPSFGVLDQAWLRLAGFTVGIYPSFFDFPLAGYSFTNGYATQRNTPLVAYTRQIGDIGSVSLSFEDPLRRTTTDGVLASAANEQVPDIVGQVRLAGPQWMVQVAGAFHQIRDRAGELCCGTGVKTGDAFALMAGGEYKWKWSDLLGVPAGDMYGRVMWTGAIENGAVAYLGAPNFGVDYVTDENGTIHGTPGRSMVVSYEHLWSPWWKSTINFSLYSMSMSSGLANIGTSLAPYQFSFDYRVSGTAVQLGTEHMINPNWVIGVEFDRYMDHASGVYAGFEGGKLNPAFSVAKLYIRSFY